MNSISVIRWSLLTVLFTSVILPVYLAIRTQLPEFLFLLAPILSAWVLIVFNMAKSSKANETEE
jgi:hypothetical protein